LSKQKNTIKGDLIRSVKIRHSEFITHLFFASSIKSAKEKISYTSKIHKGASHNCWGYIVGEKDSIYHSSDDGEPRGTAGKQILNTLFSFNLINICVVITRYFGGTKLGIKGLIKAYSCVTKQAVQEIGYEKFTKTINYELSLPYYKFDKLHHSLKKIGLNLQDVEYASRVVFKIAVPLEIVSKFLEIVTNQRIEIVRLTSSATHSI